MLRSAYRSSATSRTVVLSDTAKTVGEGDRDVTFDCTSDTAVTITLPQDVANPMAVTFTQEGAGQISFVASGNATIACALDTVDAQHRYSAGQYAAITARMVSNSDGTHANWRLYGFTASQ